MTDAQERCTSNGYLLAWKLWIGRTADLAEHIVRLYPCNVCIVKLIVAIDKDRFSWNPPGLCVLHIVRWCCVSMSLSPEYLLFNVIPYPSNYFGNWCDIKTTTALVSTKVFGRTISSAIRCIWNGGCCVVQLDIWELQINAYHFQNGGRPTTPDPCIYIPVITI